ncbi:MAG TPA: ferritin-like domain-containing protein [Flavipsychrobacter sp.]|nr:ferritin-like domain-containing protein [Flavipsychrobacter sp.]
MNKQTTAAKKSTAKSTSQSTKLTKPGKGDQQQESLLDKLFLDMLKDMYWSEKNLVPALKTMHDEATTDELKDAFEDHMYVTQKHITRLEKVFSLLDKTAEAKKCDAMEGLIKEGQNIIKETTKGTMTRDVGLIIAAQKVEHYEIASYGSLVQIARTIDREDIAKIIEKTLWEEEDTDQLLTNIAESDVNPMADNEKDEESDTEEE